ATGGLGRVDLEGPAHVRVTDFTGCADFRRQAAVVPFARTLERYAAFELLIKGFKNDPHATAAAPAQNTKSPTENLSRLDLGHLRVVVFHLAGHGNGLNLRSMISRLPILLWQLFS
ncbi:MAG: hypothetical protein JJE04_04875, partial [Acidobacteriia bacterium]|nr:hypothetical protein [Terriglobia bacterium]